MTERRPGHLPKIIAHRGARALAPENTMSAFRKAADLGARAIEFDVTVSADGTPVLMHDEDLNRCTNATGPVILKTLDELQALDAGSWFRGDFAGERIPTLEQVLGLAMDRGLAVNLEIKPTIGWEEPTVAAVAETLKRFWHTDNSLVVSSFNPLALEQFRAEMPDVDLGLLVDAVPDTWADRMKHFDCVSLHCHAPFVTRERVRDVHDQGYFLHVFTVNDVDLARELFTWGVDAVFTDHPDIFLEAFGNDT